MLKILHISDFHFSTSNSDDFEKIANRLRESLKDKDFDLVVFSGDLVFEGKKTESFEAAFNFLLRPILDDKSLNINYLMICPGNHDMWREQEIPVIKKELSEVKNLDELDKFLSNKIQTDLSFQNHKAYNEFISKLGINFVHANNFINVNLLTICNKKIGLINLNSAWRCQRSELDRGNLLFPVDELSRALNSLNECDLVLCNMHHSISDFKDFVEQSIDDLIYDKCDILFTGHCHKDLTSAISGTSIGLLHSRAAAVYNRKDPISKYGYCLIEYDEEEYTANIRSFRYIDNIFVELPNQKHHIPVDEERRKIIDFRKTMRKREREFSEKADDIFVAGRRVSDGMTTFKQLFTEPILRSKSYQDYLISKSKGELVTSHMITESDDDYIVYGVDKCGKTSLLWKILLDTLHDYFKLKTIPFYKNCKEIVPSLSKPLLKEMSSYLEMNKADTENTFKNYRLLLILDNFKIGNSDYKNWLESQLKDFPNVRIIVSSEETIVSGGDEIILDSRQKPQHLFFHEITHKEIHQLSEKWPNLTHEKRLAIEKRINQIFKQMHIPFNYWTASLFIWIFEKTDEANIHNNFELVKYYVEELLNRKSILLDHTLHIQYEDLESYLGDLSHYLLSKEDKNYTVTSAEIISFTEEYSYRKKKFTETPQNVVNYLLNTGTIYEKTPNRFTFRLKGVWEYFLAYHMTEDYRFRDNVVDNLEFYLSFSNEIELYAGFQRNDIDFVKKVFGQTKIITNPVFGIPQFSKVDNRLIDQLTTPLSIKEIVKISERSDLFDQEDDDQEILVVSQPIDHKEMELKKRYDTITPTVVNIQKALFILCRVYRNSLVCDEKDLGDEILDFTLNGTCNLGFMIHDEFRLNITDEDSKKIVEGVASMLPLIMQTFLYDAMCQKSLSRVFEEKLNELLINPDENQFRIFLLTSCLLDLDIDKFNKYLLQAERVLKKGALRYSLLLKAEVLYSKEDGMNANSRNILKEFIINLHIEMIAGRADAQERINELDQRRDIRINAVKGLLSGK